MEVGEADILLLRSPKAVIIIESLFLHPFSVMVTKYFVGVDGNTVGVAVPAPIILVAGNQEKLPVPVAVSGILSSLQIIVSGLIMFTAGVGNTVILWVIVSLHPLLLAEMS